LSGDEKNSKSPRFRLSLAQTGILLVIVPLVSGLLFIGTLSFLLQRSQMEVERNLLSKAVITRANIVSRLFVDASLAMSSYCLTGVPVYADRYEVTKKALFDELVVLAGLKVNAEQERTLLRRISENAQKGTNFLDDAKRTVETTESDNLTTRQLFKGIRSIAGLLEPDIQKLMEFENDAEAQSRKAQSGSSDLVKYALAAGIAANFAVSIALALFFSHRVTSRLNIMRDNSFRLSRREALNPEVKGTDEIAELDVAFHQMAGALLEANRKERALVENAVEVICSIDNRNVITEVNPAAQTMWQYAPEELLGQRCINLISDDTKDATSKMFEEARRNSTVTKFENRTLSKSGKLVDSQWSVSWSPNDNSLYCVIHDISERKKVEQLKREFIQMVSHDLRIPLTSLQMTLDLLLNGAYGELTEKGRPRITYAFSELERLINLINQLLEFEKMESGKVEIFVEPTEIEEVVTRSVEAVRSLAERGKIKLATKTFPTEIPADGGKLIQVLINLLGNAIKFSPPETTVSVTMDMLEKFVEIRVSDQGRGIPEAYRDKIFDRFEQVSIDDSRVKGGAGLGLAISKSIIVAHKGTVGVESEEGKGSTFWIKLPVA